MSRVKSWFSLLPTLREERPYGLVDMLAVQIAFGIAAWFFLVGGFTGLYLNAKDAVLTVIFGNQIPLFLISLLALASARYGVDHWVATRAVFGHRFNDVYMIVFYLGSSIGWIAYAALLFGSAAQKISIYLGGPPILAHDYWGPFIFAAVAILVGWYMAFLGPSVLKWALRLSSVFLMIVLGYFIYYILVNIGIDKIMAMKPPASVVEDFGVPEAQARQWALALALEWNVGLGFSWAYWYGQWTRLAKTERAAYHGTLWGWGILAAIAGVFSALTAIVVGSFDPADWLLTAPVGFALLGLILFAIANVSSIMTLIYPLSITTVSRFPRLPWLGATLIFALGGIILSAVPGVFERYNIYLTFIALFTGVYGGIVTGNYLLTRGNYSIRDLFDLSPRSKYWYTGGVNIAALVAVIVGSLFYLANLNPLTFESYTGLFPYITAGIPTYFVAMATYIIIESISKRRRKQ